MIVSQHWSCWCILYTPLSDNTRSPATSRSTLIYICSRVRSPLKYALAINNVGLCLYFNCSYVALDINVWPFWCNTATWLLGLWVLIDSAKFNTTWHCGSDRATSLWLKACRFHQWCRISKPAHACLSVMTVAKIGVWYFKYKDTINLAGLFILDNVYSMHLHAALLVYITIVLTCEMLTIHF